MSCIPKILELLGDKEFLPIPESDRFVIEGGGRSKGYDYLITFNQIGFRCAYVALPLDHIVNEFDSEVECASYPDFEIHGGITFFDANHFSENFFGKDSCKDKWLGFDAAGCMDGYDFDSALKYFPDALSQKNIITLKKIMTEACRPVSLKIRTKKYMEKQCKSLIDQLIEAEL